jgi:hypothetical protein
MRKQGKDRARRCLQRARPAAVSHRRVVERRSEAGSVLMLVLFACLAVAVSIQALSTVVVCAERAAVDESSGRTYMAERDKALAVLRGQALARWETIPWTILTTEPHAVEGRIAGLSEGGEWVMGATARHVSAVSRLMTSAWLEKGRDGLDLPLAAFVAGGIVVPSDRESPWLEVDVGAAPQDLGVGVDASAVGYVRFLPSDPLLGEGCSLVRLDDPWRLDPGWRTLGAVSTTGEDGNSGEEPTVLSGAESVAPGSGTTALNGRPGQTLSLPTDCGGFTPECPCLMLVTGGANLDARGRGDLCGVIVVDDGDLLLDGTTVHGAVFVTGTVDLGENGRLLFSRPVLRWATDRSLVRVRLVSGTREEGVE